MDVLTIPIIILLLLGALAGLLLIVNTNIIKVPPSTVAIFSGRKRIIANQETGEKETVGYRIVKGGSSVRIPILERVDYLSLNLITIPLRISGAYTKEGVPVSVDAVANVKIGGDDFSIGNATERFLGMPQEQIQNVIFQTMEGHLRSILGTLTVEAAPLSGITLSLSPNSLAAGSSTTATVTGSNGVDLSSSSPYSIAYGAGGSWAGNVYTSARAGVWTVTASYGAFNTSAGLTVNPGTPASVVVSPASAAITTDDTQTYSVTATDAFADGIVGQP